MSRRCVTSSMPVWSGGYRKIFALAGARGAAAEIRRAHLWDSEKKEASPDHGMPDDADDDLTRQGVLNSTGPH